ncbi:zinc finger, CCHC-type containing protein [Tanacetum coccineum]
MLKQEFLEFRISEAEGLHKGSYAILHLPYCLHSTQKTGSHRSEGWKEIDFDRRNLLGSTRRRSDVTSVFKEATLPENAGQREEMTSKDIPHSRFRRLERRKKIPKPLITFVHFWLHWTELDGQIASDWSYWLLKVWNCNNSTCSPSLRFVTRRIESVLDHDCLVLSKDFMLPDESMVVCELMERMLKHKLEIDKDVVGNDMTTAEQLIRFIKNQIAASQLNQGYADYKLYGSKNDWTNLRDTISASTDYLSLTHSILRKEAINDEMDSIMGNNTWVLADLPPGKAVIQGFKQKSRIDYFDTYAPVARISTIRLLIAMSSIHNLIIHQMDVKTAFLNGELDEEEAPKQWHYKFDELVLPNGYLLNQADKCVYSKFDETGKGVIICLYVDDMMIFGTDQVQDMGEAGVILGIKIKHESNRIAISQSNYIENVLKKFNYFDCTPVSTPMDTSEKLMPNNGQAVSQLEYSRMIGCLMYAMTCTRPDIAFAVGKLSMYTSNPGTQHWQAIQRVLKYLKKTMDYKLTYTGYPLVLEGYTDVSWISNSEDNSSTSG